MIKKYMATEKKDDFFNDENKPESNWFSFEKVGDRVKGEVVELYDAPAKGAFPAQKVFVLKQDDGSVQNVGIAVNKKYLIDRTRSVELGDIVGFEFKAEVPSATPGFAAAKSIEVYIKKGEPKESGF